MGRKITMSFRQFQPFSRGIRQMSKKLDTERMSSRIDTMLRCTQAKLNLIRGFSELGAQLGIDERLQWLDMSDERFSVTQIQVRSTNA